MKTQQWINRSHPQTLVIATFLLYFDAVAALIPFLGDRSSLIAVAVCTLGLCVNPIYWGIAFAAACGGGAYLMANDRRVGYRLAIGVAGFVLLSWLILAVRGLNILGANVVISLMFDIALFALLVHPQSKEYQRIWFK